MITDGRKRKTTGREGPPPGRGRDTTPTVAPEMTDQYPEISGRGRGGKGRGSPSFPSLPRPAAP